MEIAESPQSIDTALQTPCGCTAPTGMAGHFSGCVDDVVLTRFDQLTEADEQRWEQLRGTQSAFRTPFFSYAFSSAVQVARGDVLVAVLKRAGQTVGFFPHHRVGSRAYPVGRRFNDAHGVITSPYVSFDWYELLASMNASGFQFHSLVGADRTRMPAVNLVGTVGSFCSNIGTDSRAALKRFEHEHRTIAKQGQKTRKLARELGTLRLEVDCRDPQLLAEAIERKRAHYHRTNILDLFLAPWTRDLITELSRRGDDEPRVMLTLLWAGDTIVASHIGFRDGNLLHYWFPAYGSEFGRYSPGTALFTELVRTASDYGITTIDMGFGEQPYKMKQTDVVSDVAYGFASDSSIRRAWYRTGLAKQKFVKSLPMKETLKYVLRRLHPKAGFSDYT